MKSQDKKKLTKQKSNNTLAAQSGSPATQSRGGVHRKRATKDNKTFALRYSAINLFAEAGLLKKIKRSGWWVVGIKDPESVAEHCFRCAVMGYYMAHLEGVDPFKVMAMTLFNDIHEARINDLHKMGHYYIDFKDAEKRVFKDQMKSLDKNVANELTGFRKEFDTQSSPESIVARDADILECLLQAKEYYDNGHTKARKFFKTAPNHLKTKTAKRMWKQIKQWDSGQWWEDVVKFER